MLKDAQDGPAGGLLGCSMLSPDASGGELLDTRTRLIPVDRIVPDPEQARGEVDTDCPEWRGLV